MILAVLAGAAGVLAAVVAAGSLWHASMRRGPDVRNGYRWLALAAAGWGASFAAAEGMPSSAAGGSLTTADLMSLLALAALGLGLAGLAGAGTGELLPAPGDEPGDGPASGHRDAPTYQARYVLARFADACLLASALFVFSWVAVLAGDYHRVGESAATFAIQAVAPLSGMIALGVLLALAVRAGRAGLMPYLALIVVTLGQLLTVGDEISGLRAGPLSQILQIAGLCLLGMAGRGAAAQLARPRRQPGQAWTDRRSGVTLASAVAAAVAAAVAIGWVLGGGSVAEPAVVVAGGVAALALVVRVADLLGRERAAAAVSEESERRFRELADRTSDAVLICDRGSVIRYASPAVGDFGYTPAVLAGQSLAELIHPEDRAAAARAVRAAADSTGPQRFPCRVRAADGTWRHVETTVSRYSDAAADGRLLITARDVSDQVALRRQLTYLTLHDGLTGLPNRAFMEDRAKDAVDRTAGSQRAQAGAVFVNLDGFTGVNDSVGHGAGDLLLAQAARRLRAAVPPQETVARWGSDEFAVLVENPASAEEIVDLAERLADCIAAEPFQVAMREISVTASVGVALAGGGSPGDLLRNADVAMSRAKESGGGRVEVFASQMRADVMHRLDIASDLRSAITAGQLDLAYQPVVEFASFDVVGVEALVRWSRGGRPVPPREFLGVAEGSGLIVPLGQWVLREACGQVATWQRAGWAGGVSVNFSLREVTDPGFAASVLGALDHAGVPPGALTLEIAERVLIEGAGPVADGLAELRRRGVRLAIDNFGTGYASLAYLRQLAVDTIKIDPSFVAGLGQDATLAMLTRTIIQVGRDLGIQVVADGIEQPGQLELLRAMGCGLGQGYLIARPMPAAGVTGLASAMWRTDEPAPAPAT